MSPDILWDLGALFINADVDTATPVVETALGRVGTALDALSVGVWTMDPATMSGQATIHWSTEDWSDLDEGYLVRPDPDVREAVIAGGGLAIVTLESVVGAETCAERGWGDGHALVALIEYRPDANVVLVITSNRDRWKTKELELAQGLVMQLRQFYLRARVERRLHERRRLDELTVALATRFQGVSPQNLDEEITSALTELRDVMSYAAVGLVDVIDESMISIPVMVAALSLPPELLRVPVPDLSSVPGAEGLSLREYASQPRVGDVADLVDAIVGPEMTETLSLRTPPRIVAMLPASNQGDSVLAVVRFGETDWDPREIDALSTLASLVSQTRGRVAAERASLKLLDAQRALVSTGKIFLEADAIDADAAIHGTIERMAAHLGADLALVARVEPDHETITITHAWHRSDDFTVGAGTSLKRSELPLIDELLASDTRVDVLDSDEHMAPTLRDSPDGKWTSVAAPIRGAGLPPSAINFVWAGGDTGDVAATQELANATADLIGQLQVRLRAEEEITRRLQMDAILSDLAEGLMGASLERSDQATDQALSRFGTDLGLVGVAMWKVEGARATVESVWTPEGDSGPAVGTEWVYEREITAADVAVYERKQFEPEWADWLERQWGSGVTISAVPVSVNGRVESILLLAGGKGFADHELEAGRSFAVMLGQFRARLVGERIAAHRLRAQRLLSACAADLAEATPETFRRIFVDIMGTVAEFCRIGAIVDWRVDATGECYLCGDTWISPTSPTTDVPAVRRWGAAPLMDEVRESGGVAQRVVGPGVAGRSQVAIPRGDQTVEHILLAAAGSADGWPEETVELLSSLSRMIHEVETRLDAQRYANAAFQGAPIGVVLRDEELKLITCNRAFLDFIGAESVEELAGTLPDHVYDDPYEKIEWVQEADGRLSGDAAFRGPGGIRVWGQMRGTVVEGDAGNRFWLIHIEDITERRRAERLLRFQASHDELTGLANRRRLLEEIGTAAEGSGSVAVLLLDIDRFKNVNDSLGHERGDELLVVIADRLRLSVRPGDLVARLGGDEFAVVLPGPVTAAEAGFVAERLMRLIGEPVVLGRQKIYPTVSIGISVADDHNAVADLLRGADTAMYRAKSAGRARAEAFDEELRDEVQARMEIEAGLRGALRNDELLVHYQPEVSLHDGRVLSAEALVRWQHPTRGLLAAGAFIEIAEETGLVAEIGELVLATACAEAASWPGGSEAPVVRVNLAAAQLQREDLVALVRSVLADTGLAPSRLCLEITESAVMHDLNRSEEVLHQLKELGVMLAVDDFGTGFSSLAYVKRFPINELKIDQAFVSDLDQDSSDVAFVCAILSLAEALGLDVVAEGVETAEQAAVLLELGCHRAQGFHFARPEPAEALRDRLLEAIRERSR